MNSYYHVFHAPATAKYVLNFLSSILQLLKCDYYAPYNYFFVRSRYSFCSLRRSAAAIFIHLWPNLCHKLSPLLVHFQCLCSRKYFWAQCASRGITCGIWEITDRPLEGALTSQKIVEGVLLSCHIDGISLMFMMPIGLPQNVDISRGEIRWPRPMVDVS